MTYMAARLRFLMGSAIPDGYVTIRTETLILSDVSQDCRGDDLDDIKVAGRADIS